MLAPGLDHTSVYEAPVFSPLSETSQEDEENSFTSDDDKLERPLAIETEHTIVTSQHDEHSLPYGYKLVGDNVDKNVKPSLQRYEMRSQSLHQFHSFAVRDRVPIARGIITLFTSTFCFCYCSNSHS